MCTCFVYMYSVQRVHVSSFLFLPSVSPMDKLYSYLTKLDANEGEPLLLDGGSWPLPLIMERVLPFLVKGLGKRVKLVTLRPFNQPHVSILHDTCIIMYYTLYMVLCSGCCLNGPCCHVIVI